MTTSSLCCTLYNAEAHWPYGCTLISFHKLNVLNVEQVLYFNIFVDNSFLQCSPWVLAQQVRDNSWPVFFKTTYIVLVNLQQVASGKKFLELSLEAVNFTGCRLIRRTLFLWSFFLDTTLICLFLFVFFFKEFFYLSFSSNDVVNTGTPLHKGDKVEFYVTTDKRYTIWGDVCTVIGSARRLRKA